MELNCKFLTHFFASTHESLCNKWIFFEEWGGQLEVKNATHEFYSNACYALTGKMDVSKLTWMGRTLKVTEKHFWNEIVVL